MKVLITGSREWTDGWALDVVIQGLADWAHNHGEKLTIVHGACRGADEIADEWKGLEGIEVLPFPADWARLGKPAGILRNQQMLDEAGPDIVFAFHEDLAGSRGTKDMVRRALAAGVPAYLLTRLRAVP